MKILLINPSNKKGDVYRGKCQLLVDTLHKTDFPIDFHEGEVSPDDVDRFITDGYTALMHRNEHGRLFADSSLKWIRRALEKRLPVLSFDFGYIDHYNTFMFDFYLEDLRSSIVIDWKSVSSEIKWDKSQKYAKKYRNKILEKVATNDGSEFHGCVGIWMQWNADLLRDELFIDGRNNQWEWVNLVSKKIRDLGFKPVVKMNIVDHSEIYNETVPKIDPGIPLISERTKIVDSNKGRVYFDKEVNWKMTAGCAYHVFMSSSVSHILALTNKPVIAMGESWFNGLGIFEEPRSWSEPLIKPIVNMDARRKWLNWWLERQCQHVDSASVLSMVHDKALNYYGRS